MSAWGARGPGISSAGTCGRTCVARRPCVAACATAKQQQQKNQQLMRERVRVLRYPNGTERVIRYPDEATTGAALEDDGGQQAPAWDVSGLHAAGGATMQQRSNAAWSAHAAAPATTERPSQEVRVVCCVSLGHRKGGPLAALCVTRASPPPPPPPRHRAARGKHAHTRTQTHTQTQKSLLTPDTVLWYLWVCQSF